MTTRPAPYEHELSDVAKATITRHENGSAAALFISAPPLVPLYEQTSKIKLSVREAKQLRDWLVSLPALG